MLLAFFWLLTVTGLENLVAPKVTLKSWIKITILKAIRNIEKIY